jgi:AraC family transcriptional regulator
MRLRARIEVIAPKHLIGIGARMSVRNDATARLWQTLMPRRGEIEGRISSDCVSMKVYAPGEGPGRALTAATEFDKWAAVEVRESSSVPPGMQSYRLAGGRYAVFRHSGPASRFEQTLTYIFGEWLPESRYRLDDREHFEVLPETWHPDGPQAYEDIFVPIRE